LFTLTIILLADAFGQSPRFFKHKIGFSYSSGNQSFLEVDYRYKVNVFNVHYCRKIVAKSTWGLDLMLNPQFAESQYLDNSDAKLIQVGQEFGLNAGALCHKSIIRDRIHLYCMLSAGPHYVSGTPSRQKQGFIFSEAAIVGLMCKLDTYCYLIIGGGLRHMSNARLKTPNGGINNTLFQLGLIMNID